ncbi:MAG TPA: IPT/TIG domain-containing protein, partial [Stenomitos sp.]
MRRLIALLLGLFVSLTGCMRLPGLVGVTSGPDLTGVVRLEGYGVQASSTEVAQGATVSLIDPVSGNTFATTLTQPDGSFSLSLRTWTPIPNRPYLLEAFKGLSSNAAGASAARIRTLVSKGDTGWTSLTGTTIQITRGTTALCVISSLKALTSAQQQALLGTLTPNAGQPEPYSGTPDLSGTEYSAVWGLVNTALSANQDPLRVIARNVALGTYLRLEHGPFVTDLSANTCTEGDTLILYGHGFDPLSNLNRIFFNGVEATGVTVNAAATQLTVTVPPGATSGSLQVQVGNLVMAVPITVSLQSATLQTIAGLGDPTGSQATSWNLDYPYGVELDRAGGVFFSTKSQVLRIAPDGSISLVAGHASTGFFGDGGPANNALLNLSASDIAADAAGNLYIADQLNARIRMVPKTDGTYFGQAMTANYIYTIVGNGVAGFSGDTGPASAASLDHPDGVALDAAG